ncbi:hypothetical protein LSAT2_001497 [Lamellibrachia satsuma]|nr:hypothetical protein LSAT2_001497 [Lamellibrachia satsuma]
MALVRLLMLSVLWDYSRSRNTKTNWWSAADAVTEQNPTCAVHRCEAKLNRGLYYHRGLLRFSPNGTSSYLKKLGQERSIKWHSPAVNHGNRT